jgi:uncharacterized membrane protein YbaN (DUF454 family)
MNVIARAFYWFIEDKPRRNRIQKGKNAGIVKVLIGDGPDHAGMGIVIDPLHMITCAHVVNVAIGKDDTAEERPDRAVNVIFPMIGSARKFQAKIFGWRSPGVMPQDDIAMLEFASLVPEEVGAVIFADVTGMSPEDEQLSVFGFAQGQQIGNHIDAKFKGTISAAWAQLDGTNTANTFIQGGFSGAAAWGERRARVFGMIVAKTFSDEQRVAYMIPTEALSEFWQDLPVEAPPLPPTFGRTWTIFAGTYFLLLLAHWAWDRGTEAFSVVTLGGNQQQLAAFWGMHIYAFLTPFLLWMLIAFAKSFRLHDWIARVPSFGAVRAQPTSSSTGRTAGISLAAFIILPLAAQIHFINQFHHKGQVYIYPNSFGYESTDPIFIGEHCDRTSVHLCTKKDAGIYSLAEPRPGTKASYWENAYHYGHRIGGKGTVTFFPILQPVIILILTAFSVILGAIALFLVFRRTPEQSMRKRSIQTSADSSPTSLLDGDTVTPTRSFRAVST